MARSRYFQNPTVQDLSQPDPRDLSKTEPQHYLTYNMPTQYAGYANIDLLQDSQYVEHVWQLGDRLDHLANKYYKDDNYWWLIALVNNISYPLGITAGTVVRIPMHIDDILRRLELT
jgi:nucleoid-associated protein YgaU